MPIQTDLGLPLSVDGFLTKQNRALLRDFSKSGLCLVAASPDKLKDMQRFWGWTVEQLPGYLPSRYGQPDDLERTRKAGFVHHLVKPTDPESIHKLISSMKLNDN